MKVQELRIGDWYLSTKFQVPVICEMGDFYEIYARADGSAEYTVDDIFEPIPLTEEWLLKFGFNNINSKEYGIKCGSCWMSLSNPKDMGEWQDCYCWIFDRFKFIELKYVHQLQNLYFALTGNELTIEK